jgi:cobalt-zinc-cadmium efflux system protein
VIDEDADQNGTVVAINNVLHARFEIDHVTVQIERGVCALGSDCRDDPV